ncbi:MAG: Gfo/Idh/MocA family oxidoreductase [Oscillospiraceae bacterium]|nr:Gfo/Idh/MocA family oxidoreductase [Oscillospiraceae bacterium]
MKIGIIGTGSIARTVAPTLAAMERADTFAVASRTKEKAEDFCREFGFRQAYGSYEEMLDSGEVELAYIASPHSHHLEHMLMCIERGVPVLCEKAFTINSPQAKKAVKAARDRGVFVAEAIWTRYMPSRSLVDSMLGSGVIGQPRALSANLCYPVSHRERVREPALAGGALLDVGIYGLNFMLMCFGWDIDRIESSVQMLPTGVDGMENITVYYSDGRLAQITGGITCRSDRRGVIWGEEGYITVDNINNPSAVSAWDTDDRLIRRAEVPVQISGYEYEFDECVKAVEEGKTQCASMPLAETVRVMELMDSIRAPWGLVYPGE